MSDQLVSWVVSLLLGVICGTIVGLVFMGCVIWGIERMRFQQPKERR